MNSDLKIIKKHYGEGMMHLCRKLFSTILSNKPGKLSEIMLDNFEPNKFLYEDIKKGNYINTFKNYIFGFLENEEEKEEDIAKTPEELLKEVGYTLYECKSEEDIQKFKKYYEKGEELCTFKGGRLDDCYVFFAVKDNVEDIKRKNFNNPERQDEYGTSVISIQFTKDSSHTLSIKNRYNHKVVNPDATFSNNLDNIVPGLTRSFEKYYNLLQKNKNGNFDIFEYVRANDGKYYKYNSEINNIYYCPNNVIIDNYEVKRYAKEKYIVMDYFILDLVNKEIYTYDKSIEDDFENSFGKIKKVQVIKEKEEGLKKIIITPERGEEIFIYLNTKSSIVTLINNNLIHAGDEFLELNTSLKLLTLNNLKTAGNNFLGENQTLEKLELPNLVSVGFNFLHYFNNEVLKEISFPNLEVVGNNFLYYGSYLTKLYVPKLREVVHNFLVNNLKIKDINVLNLKKVGSGFLTFNDSLEVLDAPKLEEVGRDFLRFNKNIKEVNLPNLKILEITF